MICPICFSSLILTRTTRITERVEGEVVEDMSSGELVIELSNETPVLLDTHTETYDLACSEPSCRWLQPNIHIKTL